VSEGGRESPPGSMEVGSIGVICGHLLVSREGGEERSTSYKYLLCGNIYIYI
jgi:hypothetical protein